jgi:hypothetical protein
MIEGGFIKSTSNSFLSVKGDEEDTLCNNSSHNTNSYMTLRWANSEKNIGNTITEFDACSTSNLSVRYF